MPVFAFHREVCSRIITGAVRAVAAIARSRPIFKALMRLVLTPLQS
jgi:hypothetical protein